MSNSRPRSVNILGIEYQIDYEDNPADVDLYHREALWGQIDYWTRTIRIYDNGRCAEDRWHTILHEVIHGIALALKIQSLEQNEDDLDVLALALTDVLFRNGWIDV